MLYKYNNGGKYLKNACCSSPWMWSQSVYGPETEVKDKGALMSAQAQGQLHMIKSVSEMMISGQCTDISVGTKSMSQIMISGRSKLTKDN